MTTFKTFLAVFLVAVVLPTSFACKCSRVPTLPVLFYGPSRNLVRATVTRVEGSGITATYFFRTEQNYKGCPPPKTFFYKAKGTSCDRTFVKGVSYIAALKAGPSQNFGFCGYEPAVASLSEEEREFLNGRKVCCKGACRCVRKPPIINCLIAPCDPIIPPPCEEAVKCVHTKCAPCTSEWLTASGEAACEPLFPF